MDLTKMSTDELNDLQAALKGELARRSGKPVLIAQGEEEYECPPGGAILFDRPAIGGDRNRDEWYPTLDAANAALLEMAAGRLVTRRADGGLYLDYTVNGCRESRAWVRAR